MCDARSLQRGSYSAWLTKSKKQAGSRWFTSSVVKRYYTIDFDLGTFSYSSAPSKPPSKAPIRFQEISGAELVTLAEKAKAGEHAFGFTMRTFERSYQFRTHSAQDSARWVDALNSARTVAKALNAQADRNLNLASRDYAASDLSATTAESTDNSSLSGHSTTSEKDLPDRGGLRPWEPAPTSNRTVFRSTPPAEPAPLAELSPSVAEVEVDPFAALDGLADSVGSVAHVGPREQASAAVQARLLREASLMVRRGIAPQSRPADVTAAVSTLGPQRSAAARGQAPNAERGGRGVHTVIATSAALDSATTAHNDNAEAWDSDDDDEGNDDAPAAESVPEGVAIPSRCVQAMEMPREAPRHVPSGWINEPSPAPQQKQVAALAPRNAGWDTDDDDDDDMEPACTQAQVSIPAGPVAQQQPASADASGWDSDEEKKNSLSHSRASASKKASKSKQAVITEGPAAPTACPEESGWDSDPDVHQRSEVLEGPANQAGVDTSGWDSDGGADQIPATSSRTPAVKKKKKSSTKDSVALDSCGGVLSRPAETLVVARPSKTKAKAVKEGDGELDDILGDVLSLDTSAPADAAVAGGPPHAFVPGFHCTQCDFQVLRIADHVWTDEIEYMFCRNFYPNAKKLKRRLRPKKDGAAFCCQCSWKSAQGEVELVDVAEGLRWTVLPVENA
jgi:hypothetical protein